MTETMYLTFERDFRRHFLLWLARLCVFPVAVGQGRRRGRQRERWLERVHKSGRLVLKAYTSKCRGKSQRRQWAIVWPRRVFSQHDGTTSRCCTKRAVRSLGRENSCMQRTDPVAEGAQTHVAEANLTQMRSDIFNYVFHF